MSGRHRRPEPDTLADVDLVDRLEPGPVIATPATQVVEEEKRGRRGILTEPVSPPPAQAAPPVASPAKPSPPVTASPPVTPKAGQAAAVSGQTVVVRRNRAAERAARRDAARKRNLKVMAAVAAVLVGIAGTWWLVGRGGDGTDATAGGAPVQQQTLLVQVSGDDGVAVDNALLGVTPAEEQAASLLIPSRLIVDVAGAGTMSFGETLPLPSDTDSAGALTDLLGVTVDNSWVLTKPALAALVDKVGGVQAEVDVDVVTKDAKGQEVTVVRAGAQKLNGEAAAAYATYGTADEPEQARLARYNDVLDGVIRALPSDPAALTTLLQSLGDGSKSTAPPGKLAEVLAAAQTAAKTDALTSDVLPVNEIDSGTELVSYGIAAGQAADLLRSRFPGALQEDAAGESLRVLVENGVGTPGLVEQARAKLVDDGFRFVNGGNAAEFGLEQSMILIPDGTQESQDRGERVAKSLGLPERDVAVSDRGQTVADVIVILGLDFKP